MEMVALVFGLIAMFAGAVPGEPDPDRLEAAYAEAFNANDATRLAALFAEDAVLMPPDHRIIKGRAAVEASYRERFALRPGELRMQRLDFDTHGDSATAVGTFTMVRGGSSSSALPRSPDTTVASGKYIVIYRRISGQWLITYQILNYDSPQPR